MNGIATFILPRARALAKRVQEADAKANTAMVLDYRGSRAATGERTWNVTATAAASQSLRMMLKVISAPETNYIAPQHS